MSKYKVYTIQATSELYKNKVQKYTDTQFREVSRNQGRSFTLKEFQESFNTDKSLSDGIIIRIIKEK